MNTMKKFLNFLCKFEEGKIAYTIEHNRDDAVMVTAHVPGAKWEIEFFADDNLEIEIFRSNGEIQGEESLDKLLNEFSD